MEADTELSDLEEDGRNWKKKVDKEKSKRKEQEEEQAVDEDEYEPTMDDDLVNEPNFIWNENEHTSWGKCYFKALKDDKAFGDNKTVRHPFYRNEDGFILKGYPNEGQNWVYIPDGKCKIGGEFYFMRTLLIHSAHHCLAHYGISKTYCDIPRDTFWPGQWEETKRFVEGCHTCQIIKQPTQRPAGAAQMMQVTEIDKHGNLRLNIPRCYSRHRVFAPDMLKHYHDNPEHQRNISPEDKEPDQYTINRIIDHTTTKDGKKYLV